jgi:hypothetical protein
MQRQAGGLNMIRNDIARIALLIVTAVIFLVIAVRAVAAPEAMASALGYALLGPNGYSEFFAIYLGVWVATAGLALLAALRIRQALLGDLVAMFVLAQPAGRLVALLKFGAPEGFLLAIFALEAVGGLLILGVRPSVGENAAG